MERVNRGTPPVECHGKAGDVVFWHHRLGHMAGHNYSSRIRQAVLYDYCKRDLEQVQDQPP
ncbi:MAG: phytanoyl-CoA dioxygenase family protein, partial [Spirochaetaceae bacterium]|nr:phytanoyl-CoA dioxygenase family protein [Spirochaetaceae bacterium]